ncbi:glutathione synthase [Nitrosomonas marina]|uniref:Glutathione synthetase n=1 Tax=Nitrosomonas marina TaxID=917 RepID=A0A1H8E040_9PROT|nr:glutathione synthase [Nitrosomonas marina]SEN12823.1 glutathione synthase [Nitrosomonas marina]
MKLAFILDPLETLKIYKDSSYAMMREAASRNHEIYTIQQEDLIWKDDTVVCYARSLTLAEPTGSGTDWYRNGDRHMLPMQAFDAVLMRKDPPFNMEYLYSTYLLELAERQGARVINSPRSIRDFNEKLAIARFPQFMPPTLVTRQEPLIMEFLHQHRDIILKPLDSMGGSGIFRIHDADHNVNVILETMTHYGTRTIMAQRFIPEIVKGDKRILLIAGKPVPYALARIPKPGETRGNLNTGGTGVAQPLSDYDKEIAETLGPELVEQGLLLVGLDVIGDCLTEINVTSPTGIQEIYKQTGFNAAGMMIDAVEDN